mmetsp:Transcript_6271/g.17563  ORF Transcript_6271/g.17563 Transcript_6271/m.17563 type:complete len:148 (+) Transcript_6271:71-514(+)
MRYVSTRGRSPPASFAHAISTGYAPDGGLYVPECLPTVGLETLRKWSALKFQDLCVEIMALWVGEDIPAADLRGVVAASFAEFSAEEVVPLAGLRGAYVAELFHGPTLAFKDFGQQVLCKLVDYFARKSGKRVTLVVSTTGDTGPVK